MLAWITGLTILFGWLTAGGFEWFYARDGLAFVGGIVIMAVLIGLAQVVMLRRVLDGTCPNLPNNWDIPINVLPAEICNCRPKETGARMGAVEVL